MLFRRWWMVRTEAVKFYSRILSRGHAQVRGVRPGRGRQHELGRGRVREPAVAASDHRQRAAQLVGSPNAMRGGGGSAGLSSDLARVSPARALAA